MPSQHWLIKESFIGISTHLYAMGIGVIFSFLSVRYLGAQNYGAYVLITVIIQTTVILAQIGINKSIIPEIASRISDPVSIKKIFLRCLFIVTLSSLLFSFLVFYFKDGIMLFIGLDTRYARSITFFLPAVIFSALANVAGGYLAALKKIPHVLSVKNFFIPSFKIILLGAIFLAFSKRSPVDKLHYFAVLYFIVELIHFIILLFYSYRKTPSESKIHIRTTKPPFSIYTFILISLPILSHSVTMILNSSTDKIMLGRMSPGLSSVAIYNLAAMFTTYISIPHAYVTQSYGPRAGILYSKKKGSNLHALYKKTTFISTAFGLLIASALVLWGDFLLGMYAAEFSIGYTSIILLSVARIITVSFGPCGYTLMMIGRTRILALNTILAAIINVLCNLFLIPILGINGAALATIFSFLTHNTIFVLYLKNKLKILPFSKIQLKLIFLCCISLLFAVSSGMLFSETIWNNIFKTVIFSFSLFFLLKFDNEIFSIAFSKINQSFITFPILSKFTGAKL